MFITRRHSSRFSPDGVVDPDRRGGVNWTQFNESFEALQKTPWSEVNQGRKYGPFMRLLRAWMAYVAQRRDAILDLSGKARAFWRLDLPKDPDVVFFGAEAGWEAQIIQALFGDGGRVVLIDNDPVAYERFLAAPDEVVVRAPRSFPQDELVIRRDRSKIEYLQADFFDVDRAHEFDVGIDWGIIEHYPDDRKVAVMKNFQRFIKEGGVEISSCPRDTLAVRAFYYAFREEMNFGYRELMTLSEFEALLDKGGFERIRSVNLPAHNIVASRVRHET